MDYNMINKLFIIINQFYVVLSNLYLIINKLFKKIIFLLIFSKVNMKLNKNLKIWYFCRCKWILYQPKDFWGFHEGPYLYGGSIKSCVVGRPNYRDGKTVIVSSMVQQRNTQFLFQIK